MKSHKNDPITSRIQKPKTICQKLRRKIAKGVLKFPMLTAGELAKKIRIDYSIMQRRISECVEQGLITREEGRFCKVKDTICTTLLATDKCKQSF